MQSVRDGQVGRLGDLFDRYHRPVFQFLARTTGDPAAAEDLVQEVFMRILKYRHTFDGANRFETWLFRIARNVRADHYGKRAPASTGLEEAEGIRGDDPGPAALLERAVDLRQLQEALHLLDDEPRDLLVLARYHAMPYDRIAELLGIEVGAVKVRVHRAMKQLRAAFFKLEGAPCTVKK